MIMGFTTHKHLDLCADDEDPSQLIIRPEWDAPHVRCLPRVICAWTCLLRQVGTALGSPCDCIMTGITYANPGSRHNCPSVICLPRITVLSSFGRETSLVNITGPRSIFSSLFTRSFTFLIFYFQLISLSLSCVFYPL